MIIPRLLEDLEHTLPVASFWLEQQEPLPALNPKAKERQRQLVELPELEKVRIPIKKTKELEYLE